MQGAIYGGEAPPSSGVSAVAWPVAVVAAVSLVAVVASAGAERREVVRVAGLAAAVEAGLGILVGLAAWRLRGRAAAGMALAASVGATALFVLSCGVPPRFPRGSTGSGDALLLVLVPAVLAGLARRVLPLPASGRERFLVPVLVTGAVLGPYLGRIPAVASVVVVGAIAGAALGVLLARALPERWEAIAQRVLALGPLAVLATGLAVAGLGAAPFPRIASRPASRAPDVLLVVLDTTRADHAPASAGATIGTPCLARLAAEGTRWTHAFSTSSWTVPAHASLFTGLLPREHRTDWTSPYLPSEAVTIAERFRAAGYRTAGFSANPWITPEFGFDQGFDAFTVGGPPSKPYVPWSVRYLPALYAHADGAALFEDAGGLSLAGGALRALAGPDPRPAFVFLNLMEAHLPYHAPERFLGALRHDGWGVRRTSWLDQSPLRGLAPGSAPEGEELAALRKLYDASVAYDDFLVGRIVGRLRAAGRLDGTIVVVVGDHGDNLGEHAPLDHQLGVWDSLLRVPLLVRAPGRVPAGEERAGLVSIADVPAALASLAGLSGAGASGAMLAGPSRETVAFSYVRPGEMLDRIRKRLRIDPAPWDRDLDGIRSLTHKYVEGSDGSREAYDVVSDPHETVNLLAGGRPRPPEIDALAAGLAASTPRVVLTRRGETPMSDEERARLRSLGYVQ